MATNSVSSTHRVAPQDTKEGISSLMSLVTTGKPSWQSWNRLATTITAIFTLLLDTRRQASSTVYRR